MNHLVDNQKPTVVISGEMLTETRRVDEDVATEPAIHISQEAFPLCEADFIRLKSRAQKTGTWAAAIFIASVGMALIPLAKFLQTKVFGFTISIETWEWVAPCIGGAIALALHIIGKFLSNERKQVMKDIETHFSVAPRTKHLRERRK